MHLDLENWTRDLATAISEGDSRQIMNAARGLHNGLFFTVTSRRPLGTNVFDRDWDLLIVLDACRVDAMREVAPEFDFIDGVDSIWSVGSASHEWICKTFTRKHIDRIAETVFVSTNPHVPKTFQEGAMPPATYSIPAMLANWNVVQEQDFQLLRHLHRHDYEDYFATIPADLVTDHSIQLGRTQDFGQMIVHYFQPHRPYIASAHAEERPVTDIENEPWDSIRNGAATRDEIWTLYLDNLRYVLRSVERLLDNVDAETVIITADHGDLFGEFGLYGHPEGFVHPNLKKVPWVETTATDHGESDPAVDVERQDSTVDVDERLRDLGYR